MASLESTFPPQALSDGLTSLVPEGMALPCDLGRYRLLERHAHHHSSELFRAEDLSTGRQVAIKAFTGQEASSGGKAFLKEGRALARLKHPRIAQIYDCLALGGIHCLVMEWVDGVPLTESFPAMEHPEKVGPVLEGIFAALEEAHRCGLVHRDLKPEHVLVTAKAEVKLIDFGLVKRFGAALDSLSSTPLALAWRGTPAYMAPEQIKGDVLDWRADQFSLAMVLTQWLCGRHPFYGSNPAVILHRIAYGEPDFASEGVRPRMEAVLRRALSKKADDRWPSLREFHSQLLMGWAELNGNSRR